MDLAVENLAALGVHQEAVPHAVFFAAGYIDAGKGISAGIFGHLRLGETLGLHPFPALIPAVLVLGIGSALTVLPARLSFSLYFLLSFFCPLSFLSFLSFWKALLSLPGSPGFRSSRVTLWNVMLEGSVPRVLAMFSFT